MDVTPDRAEIRTEEKIPPPIKIPPPNLEKKKEKSVNDTLNKKALSDTAQVVSSIKDSVSTDTTRTRMIMAYHNAKIFKSDLQAKADSMFLAILIQQLDVMLTRWFGHRDLSFQVIQYTFK